MKAILEFSLPEEREEFKNAIRGGEYRAVLDDLNEWLRRKGKSGEGCTTAEVRDYIRESVSVYLD